MLAWLAGQHWEDGWCVPHVRATGLTPASTQPEPTPGAAGWADVAGGSRTGAGGFGLQLQHLPLAVGRPGTSRLVSGASFGFS